MHGSLVATADAGGVFRAAERELPVDDPRAAVAVLERAGALGRCSPPSRGSWPGV